MDDVEWRDDDFEDNFTLANAFREPKPPVRSFQMKGVLRFQKEIDHFVFSCERKRKRYLEDDEFVKQIHFAKKQNRNSLRKCFFPHFPFFQVVVHFQKVKFSWPTNSND